MKSRRLACGARRAARRFGEQSDDLQSKVLELEGLDQAQIGAEDATVTRDKLNVVPDPVVYFHWVVIETGGQIREEFRFDPTADPSRRHKIPWVHRK